MRTPAGFEAHTVVPRLAKLRKELLFFGSYVQKAGELALDARALQWVSIQWVTINLGASIHWPNNGL